MQAPIRSTPEMPSIMQWWILEMTREAAALETLDEPHLPHRLPAVELLRHDAAGQALELALVARVPAAPCGAGGR